MLTFYFDIYNLIYITYFVLVLSSKKGEVGTRAESRPTLQDKTTSQSIDCHETTSAVAETSERCSCCQDIWTESAYAKVVFVDRLSTVTVYWTDFVFISVSALVLWETFYALTLLLNAQASGQHPGFKIFNSKFSRGYLQIWKMAIVCVFNVK